MPVSLCEWRVRIGRFVHSDREYVIRERKEKLLMERIRRLKLLHKRLLEKGDKSEDKCGSNQNELNAKVDNIPNKSSIINNDTLIDSHKEDSFSGSESTIEENTTNRKSNGDGSEFPFHFLLLALFSLLLSLIFVVVDFSNLLESSKPLLNLGGESTWRSTCLRIIVCSSLVYILLSSIINTKEDVQDDLVLIGNENTIIKTNKTSTESTNNENNTATGTTIKSDISSTESNVEENNTQTESAIGKNYTLTDSRIREKNTTTESTKDNIPMNATITETNTPSTTRDWPSESKQSKTQTSKRKNIKKKNTMTELTTRENSSLPESTTKDDIAQKECHIDTPSTMTDKPSKRKTSKRKTLKGKKTPTESIIKDNNTPNVSTMKDNNSIVKDKSSKRNISRRKPTKDKNIATASHIKENTTTTGSTIKEKSASTESAIKYNNSVTESTMKESSTLSTIKDKVLKRKNSKRKITKYKNTATKSKIKGNTTTNESTIKDNSLTESTIKDNNSTSEATIKENPTTTKSAIKEYNSSTKSTIKGSNTPTKVAIKDDNSPTGSTVKKNHSTARSVNKGSNSTAECTIKEKNTQTESTIKVDNTTAERTINCNDTTTESTITDINSTTESTINDYNPSSVSTIKDTKTPIEPTTTDYNARIELSIKDNTSTNQCSIKEKNIPTESPIKGNNSTSESAIKDRNTTNKSAIKENNTSSRTPTEENNNLSMKVNIARAEYTIRSGIQKVLSDGKHGISSRIPSSLKGTTDNPVMQESTCLPEMILVKAGDVEQNPGPFDRSTTIQEQELLNLAYDVPSSKYTDLCIALGESYNHSQTILDRHLLDFTRSLNAVFFQWKDRQRDGTDCRNRIAGVLRAVSLDALGDKMSRGGYLPQEAAPTASSANEKKPLTAEQVNRCGEDFKTFYRTQLFKIKTDPLNFSLVFEFERIYTDLVLLRNNQGTTEKTPLDYNELLKTKVNGELPKRLIVEGEGGAGKTTFCSKMAWDWTNGADDFHEFVWVLVIPLRDIQRNQTVGDIAKTYLSDSNSVQPHQIDEYILANPSEVFIILDGLDEYDDDLVKQGNDIAKIIRSEKFKECRVLVTTRPWKADQIKSNANFMKTYAFIAVAGFDKRHISIYINKYFADDSQASRDLVKLIEDNDVIQENMAPFPIYIAMLCILWRDSDSKKRKLIRRLKTFSQLFQEIIISLEDHYILKQVTDLDKETVTRYEQLDFCFSRIGKIALSGIMNKKLVYEKDDFSSCEEAMETCCRVGVLSHETRLVRRQDRHTRPTNLVRESVFFPHKLFQEYLAGMHLASLLESDHEQYDKAMDDVIPRAKEFRYLIYFTASQSKNVGIDVISRLNNITGMNKDFLVDTAFEAYDEDVAKMVGQQHFAEQKSLIIERKKSAHTVSGYMFIMEKTTMETLIVTERSCGPTVSRDLADGICSSTTLKALELSAGATFHDDFYGILESKVNTSKIEKVCLDCCSLNGNDPTASRGLAKFLCLLPCLIDLTIQNPARKTQDQYFHDDFYHEIARLASSSKIEKVCIVGGSILRMNDPTASRDLAKFLCLLPCLTDLAVKNFGSTYQHMYLHDDFYHELARLASSSKIKKVCIDNLSLYERNSGASSDLTKFLCLLPCLTDLTIKDSDFRDDFYHKIARLALSSKIEKVCLVSCDLHINDQAASRDLAKFLCLLPCLTDLTIKDFGSTYQHMYLHDDFYHEIARLASSSKVEKVCIDGCNLLGNDPTASCDLAKFLCLLPRLTDLTINDFDSASNLYYLHDDFYHEIASLASISKNPFFINNMTWTTWYNENRPRSVPQVPSLAPLHSTNLLGRLPSEQPNQHGKWQHQDLDTLSGLVDSLESSVTQQSIDSPSPAPIQASLYQEVAQPSYPSNQHCAQFTPDIKSNSSILVQQPWLQPIEPSMPQGTQRIHWYVGGEQYTSQAALQSSHEHQQPLDHSNEELFMTTQPMNHRNAHSTSLGSVGLQRSFSPSRLSPQLYPQMSHTLILPNQLLTRTPQDAQEHPDQRVGQPPLPFQPSHYISESRAHTLSMPAQAPPQIATQSQLTHLSCSQPYEQPSQQVQYFGGSTVQQSHFLTPQGPQDYPPLWQSQPLGDVPTARSSQIIYPNQGMTPTARHHRQSVTSGTFLPPPKTHQYNQQNQTHVLRHLNLSQTPVLQDAWQHPDQNRVGEPFLPFQPSHRQHQPILSQSQELTQYPHQQPFSSQAPPQIATQSQLTDLSGPQQSEQSNQLARRRGAPQVNPYSQTPQHHSQAPQHHPQQPQLMAEQHRYFSIAHSSYDDQRHIINPHQPMTYPIQRHTLQSETSTGASLPPSSQPSYHQTHVLHHPRQPGFSENIPRSSRRDPQQPNTHHNTEETLRSPQSRHQQSS